jgi:hypothetical protein
LRADNHALDLVNHLDGRIIVLAPNDGLCGLAIKPIADLSSCRGFFTRTHQELASNVSKRARMSRRIFALFRECRFHPNRIAKRLVLVHRAGRSAGHIKFLKCLKGLEPSLVKRHETAIERILKFSQSSIRADKENTPMRDAQHQQPFLPPLEGFDIGFIGLLGFFAMVIS